VIAASDPKRPTLNLTFEETTTYPVSSVGGGQLDQLTHDALVQFVLAGSEVIGQLLHDSPQRQRQIAQVVPGHRQITTL
jgi:hypothetical protein